MSLLSPFIVKKTTRTDGRKTLAGSVAVLRVPNLGLHQSDSGQVTIVIGSGPTWVREKGRRGRAIRTELTQLLQKLPSLFTPGNSESDMRPFQVKRRTCASGNVSKKTG